VNCEFPLIIAGNKMCKQELGRLWKARKFL